MPENKEKTEVAKREEETLRFWEENKIFEKSEQKLSEEEFVFYDGPPFATGLPHYGHILAGTMKDAIPRYQTMKGKRVRRRWGWDCHGLPLENVIEQELGLKTKKDILDFGIGKFNEAARKAVLRYADDWRAIVPRLGRFVHMDDDYKTMDASYTESVWWIFKTLYNKNLIYEGLKSMHLCPRCGTTLSNFEVNQGYKDVKDISVTVKFKLDPGQKIGNFITDDNTYILAWTTTPWTLPANVALAVNKNIEYSVDEFFVVDPVFNRVDAGEDLDVGSSKIENYIYASNRKEQIFNDDKKYSLSKTRVTVFGTELVGKKYRPPFDYLKPHEQDGATGYLNVETGIIGDPDKWLRIYGAEFVNTEDGTGVVHVAPGFGEDDLNLAIKEKLPVVQHVGTDGKFKNEEILGIFAGRLAKPKDKPDETDVEIIKYLAAKGVLFAKEKITHSYPHCWRCETPLLNYATRSWFVKVTDFKDELVAANKDINWIPEHIKEGRFGKWLEGARDWAISRSRFWGAPIPVWRCESCNECQVLGNLKDLQERLPRAKNNYWAIRHGRATSNADNRVSSKVENDDHLLPEGVEEVKAAITELLPNKIEVIISSDFIRTKETAKILAEGLNFAEDKIIFDERLREIDAGELEGHDWAEYDAFFKHHKHELSKRLPSGESLLDVRKRVLLVLADLEKKYEGKNILIVSHGLPIFSLLAGADGVPDEHLAELKNSFGVVKRAYPYEVRYNLYPRNQDGSLDLHRPFIDELVLNCKCGGKMTRVPEVFDCWFESGSMPYGEVNYLGKAKTEFDPVKNVGFPADFIAEGLDQTRGWFYSLLVLGVALFNKTPYKNVIVNGLVLAEDGQKMSKRLKNYPDPMYIVNTYGADALRFYLMSAPAVRAEDLNFSEKSVAETGRKIVARLFNVLNFYQTYAEGAAAQVGERNVLDVWITSRLSQTSAAVSKNLDNYQLDKAARELDSLIDDLSNWYLRRSRDRFKSEDSEDREVAAGTTRHILRETAKLLAPFTPFLAEQVFQALRHKGDVLSVHLADWPQVGEVNDEVIANMNRVRILVEKALAARGAEKIKVRQPLATLYLKEDLALPYSDILKDEVNVKNVLIDHTLEGDLSLDTNITPELELEGSMRELVRQIQDLRKQSGLTPEAKINLKLPATYADLVVKFETEIKKATNVVGIEMGSGEIIITKV